MRFAIFVASALALASCDSGSVQEDADIAVTATVSTAEIEAVMEESAAGWNEGDMDRFLAIYSDAPETSFVGSGGLLRGRSEMEARYREAYDWSQPDPAERGVLTFETEDVRSLGEDHALYIGRYILTYPDAEKEPATGYTSLVFAREADGWKIIADHSS